MSWASLQAEFPALSPAQLHRLLTQYQLASAMGPMSAWEPGAQDRPDAFKSGELLGAGEPPAGLPWRSLQSTWYLRPGLPSSLGALPCPPPADIQLGRQGAHSPWPSCKFWAWVKCIPAPPGT